MTFAVLRALHAIVGEALDDIQAIYAAAPVDLDPDPDTPSSSSTSFPLPPPHLSFSPPTDPDLASHPRQSQSQRKSAGSTNEPAGLDFPALDDPGDPHAPAELLTAHPDVANAISRIVSAAGHMAAVVRAPFLTLCDAGMGYHLPSCLRFLETAHIPELLREAGTGGLHAPLKSGNRGGGR